MEAVRTFFGGMSDSAVLEYALGADVPGAPVFAKHVIVIVVDCEKFERPPHCLTEFGLAAFERKDMLAVKDNLGAHGENLLRQIYFYHIRLLATAHYYNRTFCPGNPEKNRFGVTRYVTDEEARDFLSGCFGWAIDQSEPGLGACPVILLGHAVSNDLKMLQEFGVNPSSLQNVVAVIDTQRIAREKGIQGPGNQIGLKTLMKYFSADFRDGHTASNDTAYTVICAVQMAMGDQLPDSERNLQPVIDDLEEWSQLCDPSVGITKYCTRCGDYTHNRSTCRAHIKHCEFCVEAGRKAASFTHITQLCTW